jgi:hypothetical protein
LPTLESIKKLYEDNDNLIITILLSKENIDKAQELFDKLVNTIGDDTIRCPKVEYQVAKSTVTDILNKILKKKR